MKLIYKDYVIEREIETDVERSWSVTEVQQYINARDEDDYQMEWEFFCSLSDAKTYIDIISNK